MFNNIGGKIKGYAKTIFALQVIVAIIAAIAFWVNIGGFGGFMAFLFGGALMIVFAYLSVMFIYAFGELVETTSNIYRKLNNNNTTTSYFYNTTENSGKASEPQSYRSQIPVNRTNSGQKWRCSVCDTENDPATSFCTQCGQARSN